MRLGKKYYQGTSDEGKNVALSSSQLAGTGNASEANFRKDCFALRIIARMLTEMVGKIDLICDT